MNYAKIKTDGTVEQFPYFVSPSLTPGVDTLPEDVVEVDVQTNRPALRWDQKTFITGVEKVGDNYLATYSAAVDKYDTPEAKLKAITTNKKMEVDSNERLFAYKSKELVAEYSDGEIRSWDQQRAEATAYAADNTASTPLLSAIATARGITVSELATKVLANAAAYETAYGTLLGKYQKNKDTLASINLEDDTTWNAIETIERL